VRKALRRRRRLATGALAASLAASTVALSPVASAATGAASTKAHLRGSDRSVLRTHERVPATAATRAGTFAVAAVGGGQAVSVVQGPSGGFLVSVQQSNGRLTHVVLDGQYRVKARRAEA
jgi:hypothetical protein